jgi:probable F420-dependent oxidoreductase
MRVGTFLPTYWTDYGTTTVREAVEEAARAAEALGYASVWANDHVIAPAHQAGVGHIIEPLMTLASLIHLVPRLQLGTSALVLPQRHAVVVAKQVAELDVLSGGRFILGVGVGWLEEEFGFLNADFARRGAVTDEAIRAMRALWSEPVASFHGRFYAFSDAVFFPKPRSGGVPVWVCGNTRPAIRRAARVGDAWNPFGIGLHDFTAGVAYLRALTQERPLPTIAAHLRIRIDPSGGPDAHLAGSVDAITAELARYRQAGLDYLICDFVADGLDDLLRQMRVMAEQIMPALASRS